MVRNVLEFLENSAKTYPNKIGFEDSNGSITFSMLETKAKQIGSYYISKQMKNQPITVLMDKSIDCIIAMLGIVYSGNFYAPIDVSMPKVRISVILDTLKPAAILFDSAHGNMAMELGYAGDMVCFEEIKDTIAEEKQLENVRRYMIDTDPLYAIFTSGSTGVPKGVLTSHRSVIDFVSSFTEAFHITEEDIHGNQAPLDYDASVKDVYSTLLSGGKTYLIPSSYFSMPKKLFDCLEEQKITTLVWAVSAVCIPVNLKAFAYKVPNTLKKILFSGAVMPCKHLKVWQSYLPNVMYVNLYGVTETTCNCTYHIVDKQVEEDDVLSIGKPFQNTGIILLKDDNTEAAPGELGEICIKGAGLALGYYNNPEKTLESFVQNPVNKNFPELIYRTGDLGSYEPDGSLNFHGRRDFQIKHMGHRIELGEIETAVGSMSMIGDCCCLYEKENSDIYLFYVGDTTKKDIAIYLRERLPRYMIPTKFVQLSSMPRKINGKTDKQLLKEQHFLM